DGAPSLFVPIGDGSEALVAAVSSRYLFDLSRENVLPLEGEVCVLDGSGHRMHCSFEAPALPPTMLRTREDVPELRPWDLAGERHLALSWFLFLRAHYAADGWTIVVAEPEAVAYAPTLTFRRSLLLVAGLTLTMVGLLTAVRIRRRLVPLENLVEGTRRVGDGDFSGRVDAGSDDEFGELARSFNDMSGRLEGHFDALERLVSLDRSILACRTEESLVQSTLLAIADLAPHRPVALLLRSQQEAEPDALTVSSVDGRLELRERTDGEEVADLLNRDPSFTSPFVIPLEVAGATLGQVYLGGENELDSTTALHLRQLCDQVAAAVHGIRLGIENEQLLFFDPVTGLANRRGHRAHLEAALDVVEPNELVVVGQLALGRLERFAATFGASERDEVLRRVADALRWLDGAELSRLSGGEFGFIARVPGREHAARLSQVVAACVGGVMGETDHLRALSTAIGVAVFPLDGEVAQDLIERAASACHHSAGAMRSEPVFFSESMSHAMRERLRLESDLSRALEAEQLEVYYQPVANVETREIVGAEALLRWQHPERGPVSPEVFIPVAEEIGLIHEIGGFALRRACEDNLRWQREGLPAIRVAVNVSSHQLRNGNLFSVVQHALASAGLAPSSLALELTESALVETDLESIETLAAIRRLGVSISIDDFGTGYSSLAYLKRLEVDTVKIDKSFLDGIPEDNDDCTLTATMIAMGRGLGLSVIAEGCETEDQLAFLRGRGCDLIQGYLVSEPLPADAFRKLLRETLFRLQDG
ncbi:MAG: putative bifunctional diguanylate cyclase/phosphodiesterase, partial [Myxococcota bacterium]